jgi:hypothetical protein
MGSILMYELMAEERYARYRAEAEHDRQLAQFAAQRRGRTNAAARTGARQGLGAAASFTPSGQAGPARPTGTRRALAAAFVGLAAIGALRRRRPVSR